MKKILGTIFWIIVIILMCLWTYEFYRVRNGLDPQFCIKKVTHTYSDGVTEECIGLGYKVYKYNRDNLYGTEFVSIFGKERTNSDATSTDDTTETPVPDTSTDTSTDNTTSNNTNGETGGNVISQDSEVVGN